MATKVWNAFEKHLNWKTSEAEMREARKHVTFAIFSEEGDLDKVITTVDALLHPPAKELHVMKRWHNRDEFKARVLEWASCSRVGL